MNFADNAMMYNNPTVAELNKVSNFDPLKYLKKTENGVELPLKFKKLWFRLKYPQGRVRLANIRITDQLAIIEARVFLDRKDTEAVSSYTASCDVQSAPDGQYLKFAQELAIEQALNDAGFGIQFISADGEIVPTASVKTAPVQKPMIKEANPIPFVAAPAVEKAEIKKPDVEKVIQIEEKPVNQPVVIEKTDYEEIVADAPAETTVETTSQVVESAPVVAEVPAEKVIPMETAPVTTETVPSPSFTIIDEEDVTVDKESAPVYTKEMSVEDICAVMSLEEAENYVVPSGACAGQKLSQVADRRPASLRFYINGYKGDDNILRAAATLITASRPELQAS